MYLDSTALAKVLAARTEHKDGHRIWTGRRSNGEYGTFRASESEDIIAHRVAWSLASGRPIPRGGVIAHTCDIKPCVKNDDVGFYAIGDIILVRYGHLVLTTHKGNNTDYASKFGAQPSPRRRQPPPRKTWVPEIPSRTNLVPEIRYRYADEGAILWARIKEEGSALSRIFSSIRRTPWKHI